MCDLAGLGPAAGGTFTSGGTEATFTALLAARAAALPNAWKEGVGAEPPVVLHGEHAHYAVTRAVGALGLGTDAAIAIPSSGYRMDVAALAAELRPPGGARPDGDGRRRDGGLDGDRLLRRPRRRSGGSARSAGSGSTSTAPTAPRRSSRPAPERLRGVERARSLAWDPHKMMLMPLSAGVVLVAGRARPRRRVRAARALPLPRRGGGAEPRPGEAELPVLAKARRAEGLGGAPALRRRRGSARSTTGSATTARALHDADPLGRATSRRSTSRSRTSSASAGSAIGSLDPERLDALNLRLRETFNRSGEGWITTTVLGGQAGPARRR